MDAATLGLLFGLIAVALVFDFLNGLHDAANSIATIVSTRVLPPRAAVLWAAFFNFIAFLFFGLRVIGFDWFGALGDLPAFDHVGLWGWLAVATGIVWLAAALGLWSLQPWARFFAMFIAGLALFEAVLAFFQFTGSGVGFAMSIMPLLILWYLNTDDVKTAFEGQA